MADFIVTHRLAGRRQNVAGHLHRKACFHELCSVRRRAGARDVGPEQPAIFDRSVVHLDEDEVTEKRAALEQDPAILVEKNIGCRHPRMTGLHCYEFASKHAPKGSFDAGDDRASLGRAAVPGAPPGPPGTFSAVIVGKDGQPIEEGEVVAIVQRAGAPAMIPGRIEAGGKVTLRPEPSDSAVLALQVEPHGGYFKAMVTQPANGGTVELDPLPMNGPLGWWHQAMGLSAYDPTLGAGIRVGVIDMGVGPNAALSHIVPVGSVLNERLDRTGGADVGGHGSLVCGLIGARPLRPGGYAGFAPGAQIFSVRVYPSESGTAQLSDIAAAIELLSTQYACDLINMSLATDTPSEILEDAIIDAFQGGTLCLVAAGNQASVVKVPASLPQTVAVTAIGKKGWAPAGSLDALMGPGDGDTFFGDGLFFGSKFSNRGPQVTCTAPGVGLISTLPDPKGRELYGADTGTSLACPMVTGALAGKLSRDRTYLAMPRGIAKVQRALELILQGSSRMQLPMDNIGIGLPQLIR